MTKLTLLTMRRCNGKMNRGKDGDLANFQQDRMRCFVTSSIFWLLSSTWKSLILQEILSLQAPPPLMLRIPPSSPCRWLIGRLSLAGNSPKFKLGVRRPNPEVRALWRAACCCCCAQSPAPVLQWFLISQLDPPSSRQNTDPCGQTSVHRTFSLTAIYRIDFEKMYNSFRRKKPYSP